LTDTTKTRLSKRWFKPSAERAPYFPNLLNDILAWSPVDPDSEV
jgi:hypothetical protein